MRWWLLVSSFLFCFSTLAEVVCRSPGGGDEATEAGDNSSVCNPEVQANGSTQAVERDVNPAKRKNELASVVAPASEETGGGEDTGNVK